VISDPLHLLKRVRYRWASPGIAIGFGVEIMLLSTRDIDKQTILSLVIFVNSYIITMHDSLPLRLLSSATFQRFSNAGMDTNS
jgi:hypothetical protein